MTFSVIIPSFNEEISIGRLLESLLAEPEVKRIVVADDRSTDSTRQIVEEYARKDSRVVVSVADVRSGQLAGWIRAATLVDDDVVVFIDADSRPAVGAVGKLASAISTDVAVASGRVEPVDPDDSARFSANAFRNVRLGNFVREVVIGRFFAADRKWFLKNAGRTDIIANDTYLSCLAAQSGRPGRYVDDAAIYYAAPQTPADFAAQRQRADRGYKQLREMQLLLPSHQPSALQLLRILAGTAMGDPRGAAAWLRNLWYARTSAAAYRVPAGASAGIWETQASTKRAL